MVLSLFYKVGFATPITAKVVGAITTAAAGIIWYLRFRKDSRPFLWLVGPLYLLCPITAFWAVSGLELGLHTLLLTLLVLAWLGLPLFVLSRPEAAAVAVVLMVVLALWDRHENTLNLRYYTVALAVVVFTVVGLTVFRLKVFGYPLPNTFYAKTHYGNTGFAELARMSGWFFPLMAAIPWALFRLLKSRFADRLLTVSVALFLTEAAISCGVDAVMNFWFRYLIPFLPFLLIAVVALLESLRGRTVRASYLVLAVVSLVAMAPWLYKFELYNESIIQSQERMIAWARNLPETTTISMTDMGRIPYETKALYHDLWGLVDHDMAHKGFNGAWEFLKLPDYFVFVGYMDEKGPVVRFPREQNIAYSDHFSRCYTLTRVFSPDGMTATDPAYSYLVFRRLPDAHQIVKRYSLNYWQHLLYGGGNE